VVYGDAATHLDSVLACLGDIDTVTGQSMLALYPKLVLQNELPRAVLAEMPDSTKLIIDPGQCKHMPMTSAGSSLRLSTSDVGGSGSASGILIQLPAVASGVGEGARTDEDDTVTSFVAVRLPACLSGAPLDCFLLSNANSLGRGTVLRVLPAAVVHNCLPVLLQVLVQVSQLLIVSKTNAANACNNHPYESPVSLSPLAGRCRRHRLR